MASKKTPAPPAFDLVALRHVRDTVGEHHNFQGEPFCFRPDPEAVAGWLRGGVPFQIPLGAPREVLGDLCLAPGPREARLLGEGDCISQHVIFGTPTPDLNASVTHGLTVKLAADDTIEAVSYGMRGWTLRGPSMTRVPDPRFYDPAGRVLPGSDNTAFMAVLEQGILAAGFALRGPPGDRGKKKRAVEGGEVTLEWKCAPDEIGFHTLDLWVEARAAR